MDIKDVISELKEEYSAKSRHAVIAQRIRDYGIRTVCMMCGFEGRHRPGHGRLRERACTGCGMQRLRPRWWIEKYPTKAHAEMKRIRGTSFLV